MFKYFSGIAIMCVVFAVMAVFYSNHGFQLASIYLGVGCAFFGVAVLTASPKSRW